MEEKRERENVDTSGPNISNLIPLMLTNPSTSLANPKGLSYEVVHKGQNEKKILLLMQTSSNTVK